MLLSGYKLITMSSHYKCIKWLVHTNTFGYNESCYRSKCRFYCITIKMAPTFNLFLSASFSYASREKHFCGGFSCQKQSRREFVINSYFGLGKSVKGTQWDFNRSPITHHPPWEHWRPPWQPHCSFLQRTAC